MASCGAATPNITSGPTTTALSSTSVRVDWTTDCDADSRVVYSYANDDGFGNSTPITDTGGTTSHSVTVTGLFPSGWYSQAISRSTADTTKAVFSNPFSMAPAAIAAGAYDYVFNVFGPKHVYQGSSLVLTFDPVRISDTTDSGNQNLNITLQNMPPNTTLSDTPTGCGGSGVNGANTIFYFRDCGTFNVVLQTTGSTPVGTYSMNIKVDAVGGVPGTKNIPWTIVVEPPATFALGTPTSYPPIPCMTASSKQMDGTSACTYNWEDVMVTYGAAKCNTPGSIGVETGTWYYDGQYTYNRIKQYDATRGLTGNPSQWDSCATQARDVYQPYVTVTNNGAPQGWRVFPHGLYHDWMINGSVDSRTGVSNLAIGSQAVYGNLDRSGLTPTFLVREGAYRLNAELFYIKATGDTSRLAKLSKILDVNIAKADQWIDSPDPFDWIQPFMVGLWAQALITCYEDSACTPGYHDPRIGAVIKRMADYLWANAYNLPNYPGAMYYNSKQASYNTPPGAGTDLKALNLLIAPMYAWLFARTGDSTYQVRGDTLLQNMMLMDIPGQGCGWNGKQFNECYRWSFEYMKWRSAPAAKSVRNKVNHKRSTV